MALTSEDLKAIAGLLDEKLNKKIDPLEQRMDTMEQKMGTMEQKMDTMEQRLSAIESDVAGIKSDLAETKRVVDKHYNMFEEFYVHQAEENTRIWNQFHIIGV